jgi:hypothetical protein
MKVNQNLILQLLVNMRYVNWHLIFFGLILLSFNLIPTKTAHSQPAIRGASAGNDTKQSPSKPIVAGYGKGLFQIGELIYGGAFENSDDWVLQIEESDAEATPRINFGSGSINVLVPDRGATIWNRNKFRGPIAIIYKVKAPTKYVRDLGIVVRDINCFWQASAPDIPNEIFNQNKYTGAFTSYHKQQGYYASMGGRDNTTTRFRRYPRIKDGKKVNHITLTNKDGQEGYLIEPDKTHTIQLVAYDDVIQYIVDRKVFYEIREGDTVRVSRPDGTYEKVVYSEEQFSSYNEGWFGFRLVNTHHIYSDFRVYRLEPAD